MRWDQQKRELRSSFRQRADLFQAPQSAYLVERLNENLISFLKSQKGTWAAFNGTEHEPRLHKVIQASGHLNWVYPRINEHHLEFVATNKFATGRFGIEEPVGHQIIPNEQVSGFLIPGLAFDVAGSRLGRGKGFYDKALAHGRGLKIGICFSFQVYEGLLPAVEHDVKMDAVISDQGLVVTNTSSDKKGHSAWKL